MRLKFITARFMHSPLTPFLGITYTPLDWLYYMRSGKISARFKVTILCKKCALLLEWVCAFCISLSAWMEMIPQGDSRLADG